ncbi:hypothetical protein QJS10_CPA16g01096 [Acorus calamus]|uniref:Uncharacterized protein n=1 Tax=Acorus calamus TaxID=4465 RepID=A0AAV9D1K8_ACOCL|nr:hypothetical protein QJS10_CPA16g01096 [Acorus calamus]
MFRLLSERLLLVKAHHGVGPSTSSSKTINLWLFHGNPSLKSISHSSESTPTDSKSLTVSYLTSSCGLSPEAALKASKWFTLKTPKNADLVLDFLRNHGFDQTQIAKVITCRPRLLELHPERNLKTKMDFFTRYGFSDSHLVSILSGDPTIFTHSLDRHIASSLEFLEGIFGTKEDVIAAIYRSMYLLNSFHQKRLMPNISSLRDHGVPASHASKYVLNQPKTFCMADPDRFCTAVVTVHGMSFNPLSTIFFEAVRTLLMSKTNWEGKFELFRNLGWSKDDILSAFKRQPTCMRMSEKKIKSVFEFFVGELGWEPSSLSGFPILLCYDLEKRVIPRCSVLQVLLSKDLIKKDMKWTTALKLTEKQFLERFVAKYEEEAPELMRTYQHMIESKETNV